MLLVEFQVIACSLQYQMPEVLKELAKIWDCCTGVTMKWDTDPKTAPFLWGYLSPERILDTNQAWAGHNSRHLHFDVACQSKITPHRHRLRHCWHLIWHRWRGSPWTDLDRMPTGKRRHRMAWSISLPRRWWCCTALLRGLPSSTTFLSLLPLHSFSLWWVKSWELCLARWPTPDSCCQSQAFLVFSCV